MHPPLGSVPNIPHNFPWSYAIDVTDRLQFRGTQPANVRDSQDACYTSTLCGNGR
jgi:hypothetical protein